MKQLWKLAIAAIAVMVLSARPAEAALFMAGYTATYGSVAPPVDATLSVAVYSNNGSLDFSDSGDVFGLGITNANKLIKDNFSPGFDTALQSAWIYLYQLVNTDFDPSETLGTELFTDARIYTIGDINQVGMLNGYVFNDGANVGPATNVAVGADPTEAEVETSASFVFTGASISVAGDASAKTVSAVAAAGPPGFQAFGAAFANPFVSTDEYSSLFGYTSDFGPTFGTASLQDIGNTQGPTLVAQVAGGPILPVPGTAILFGSLIPVLGGFNCFKRNRQAAA